MNRIQYMTIGLVLVFVGAQFYFAETYVLTPQASKAVGRKSTDPDPILADTDQFGNQAVNYMQASYSNVAETNSLTTVRKEISPPSWLCWPILCLGAVFFLHGLALPSADSSSS